MIAPFSFSEDSASLKIPEIVVFGTLSIPTSDGTIRTFSVLGDSCYYSTRVLLFVALCTILDSIHVAQH